MSTVKDRFEGCIIGGAIGDAMGSNYENQVPLQHDSKVYYPFGKPLPLPKPVWHITDDTQLTLATCEAILENEKVEPASIAQQFVQLYKRRQLTGLGVSTLKSIRELELGGHWSQVGRKGEYAAGNGAATRIAPLAFVSNTLSRQLVENISKITHHNDEAYAGALCVVIGIQAIIQEKWTGKENLFEILIGQLPDTRVRDRLLEINKIQEHATIQSIAQQFGNRGYVVESVPLALFAASKVQKSGLEQMFQELIVVGGDTDSNCSIAGQIAGTLLGIGAIPEHLLDTLKTLQEYNWIRETIHKSCVKLFPEKEPG